MFQSGGRRRMIIATPSNWEYPCCARIAIPSCYALSHEGGACTRRRRRRPTFWAPGVARLTEKISTTLAF